MYWLIGIVLALGLLTIGIALFPKGLVKVGLMDSRLSPCPNTPNCVNSEDKSKASFIAPLLINETSDSAWQRVKKVIESSGGSIQAVEQTYLWATFTTKWLRFVDDVELRMDADSQVIHVRSASRVGRSDLGVNRERVEQLRSLFNSKQTTD
jgi:uncharacterized protein (DUF1499 family)